MLSIEKICSPETDPTLRNCFGSQYEDNNHAFYHGTTFENAQKILDDRLKSRKEMNVLKSFESVPLDIIYFTSNFFSALDYVQKRTSKHEGGGCCDGAILVFEFSINQYTDETIIKDGQNIGIRPNVQGEYIQPKCIDGCKIPKEWLKANYTNWCD